MGENLTSGSLDNVTIPLQLRADLALSELVGLQKQLLKRQLDIVDRLTKLEVRDTLRLSCLTAASRTLVVFTKRSLHFYLGQRCRLLT